MPWGVQSCMRRMTHTPVPLGQITHSMLTMIIKRRHLRPCQRLEYQGRDDPRELASRECPHGEGICCPVVCLPFPWFGQGASEYLELPTGCVAGRTWFTGTLPHRGRHKGDGHIAYRASDPRDDAVTLHSPLTQAQTCQEGDPLVVYRACGSAPWDPQTLPGGPALYPSQCSRSCPVSA